MTNLATEEEMGICPRGCGNKEGGFGGTTRVGGRPTGHSSANWKSVETTCELDKSGQDFGKVVDANG